MIIKQQGHFLPASSSFTASWSSALFSQTLRAFVVPLLILIFFGFADNLSMTTTLKIFSDMQKVYICLVLSFWKSTYFKKEDLQLVYHDLP